MLQHSTTLSKQISIAYETQGGQDASETSFSFPRKKKRKKMCGTWKQRQLTHFLHYSSQSQCRSIRSHRYHNWNNSCQRLPFFLCVSLFIWAGRRRMRRQREQKNKWDSERGDSFWESTRKARKINLKWSHSCGTWCKWVLTHPRQAKEKRS